MEIIFLQHCIFNGDSQNDLLLCTWCTVYTRRYSIYSSAATSPAIHKAGCNFLDKSQSKLWLCDWDPAPLSHVLVFITTHKASINLFFLISRTLTDVKHSPQGQI